MDIQKHVGVPFAFMRRFIRSLANTWRYSILKGINENFLKFDELANVSRRRIMKYRIHLEDSNEEKTEVCA
jgi:hypothetical protein